MKPTARLINCARGGIVDESALVAALKQGRLAGAALDVFEQEPLPKDSPLRTAPNVILTPHLGASTEEAQSKVAEQIAQQIAAFFREGRIQDAVNLSVTLTPEIEPFANLSQTLGRLLSQMLTRPPQRLNVSARGKIALGDVHAVSVFALQGLLSNWQETSVNLVNAPLVAAERGITVSEEKSLDSPDYASLVRLEIRTAATVHSAAGTVFEGREPRIVEIDGFGIDLKPEGIMLVMFYPDQPGMVGKFGTILGNARINIAGMDVGRKEKRGRACVALSVDDPVPEPVLREIRACTGQGGEAFLVNL
jgi:D-3-phosphoglycerate dehydrogenase